MYNVIYRSPVRCNALWSRKADFSAMPSFHYCLQLFARVLSPMCLLDYLLWFIIFITQYMIRVILCLLIILWWVWS